MRKLKGFKKKAQWYLNISYNRPLILWLYFRQIYNYQNYLCEQLSYYEMSKIKKCRLK